MKRHHHIIVRSWAASILRSIALGEADAAYRLTRALVGRLRELGCYS
jgi:hypothetical protein